MGKVNVSACKMIAQISKLRFSVNRNYLRIAISGDTLVLDQSQLQGNSNFVLVSLHPTITWRQDFWYEFIVSL